MTLRRTATMKAALLGCALLAAFCLAFVSASSPPSLVDCRVASRIQHTLSVLPPEKRKPLLLFWDTEGVNHMMYGVWFGEDAYYQCPYSCEISDDRADYSRAEAVLFWATPTGKGVPFDQKCPKQLWIQSSTEAFDEVILDRTPPRGYRNGAPAIRAPLFGKDGKPLQMEGVVKDGWHIGVDEALMQDGRPSPIDHEVSWRRSLGEEKVTWLNNYDWNMDVVRAQPNAMGTGADAHRESARWIPEEILVDTKRRETRDKDQASVAAFISNCGAASPRLELLEELQKYIKVDSYGKCSHNRDVPDHWELEKDLSRGFLTQKNRILQRRYKFLLAFENSEIKDYVTEKFYHPLTLGVLPIVLGAPNIEEYSPVLPGGHPAFINIRDYQNMSSLAAYLEELDRDDEKYLRYFEWRQAKDVAPLYKSALQYSWRDSPCMVCQSLHRQLYGTPIVLQGILPEEYDRRPPAQTGAQRAAAKARREKRRREKKEKEEQRKRRRREQADGATMAAAAPSSQDQQQQNTPPPTGEELARIQALMQEHALKASGQVKDEL